ncbi:hypothetical protein H0H93_012561, partial [Arthromyces matolae]
MVQKDFIIRVDNSTIKGDIKLLFSFGDVSSSVYETVAWKPEGLPPWSTGTTVCGLSIILVDFWAHDIKGIQEVPIHWESTIAFALASKNNDHVVHPNQFMIMNP